MPVDVGLISPFGLAGEAANYSRIMPDFAAQQVARRELALRSAQEQRLTAEQQSKQQRLAQYQAELAELNSNPTTDAVSRFMMRWPEFANENKAAYDVGEQGRKSANTERVGNIVHAMETNPDLAISMLKEVTSAEAAAGKQPDPIMQRMIEDFESGDPARRKQALATGKVILARTLGPKEFAERVGGGTPSDFQKKHEYIAGQDPRLGRQFLQTTAQGPMAPAYDKDGNIIGGVRLGNLQEIGGSAAPEQPVPPGVPFKSDDGSISGTMTKDANGRPVLMSPQLSRPVRYVVTQQDYDLVGPGETYIDSYSGDPQTKPGK